MLRPLPTHPSDDDLFCTPADITQPCSFTDYREPNEGTPSNVKPHLSSMEKGWIVSTGTERSFFDLLLSPDDKCEGLIIRDINPKVKAYCDFLTLLLIYSKDREEFCTLSAMSSIEQLKETLLPKIKEDKTISAQKNSYFQQHFDDLATCYTEIKCHIPRNGDNEGIEYRKDDALFHKLQQFAKAGKIIATVGDINDLRFVGARKITVIDTSNISDYCAIKPLGYGNSIPRIIFTTQDAKKTDYYSTRYKRLDEEEYKKIEQYMDLFKSSSSIHNFYNTFLIYVPDSIEADIFDKSPINCFTKKNILKIKNVLHYVQKNPDDVSFCRSHLKEETYKALLERFAEKSPKTAVEKTLDDLFNEQENLDEKSHENHHTLSHLSFSSSHNQEEEEKELKEILNIAKRIGYYPNSQEVDFIFESHEELNHFLTQLDYPERKDNNQKAITLEKETLLQKLAFHVLKKVTKVGKEDSPLKAAGRNVLNIAEDIKAAGATREELNTLTQFIKNTTDVIRSPQASNVYKQHIQQAIGMKCSKWKLLGGAMLALLGIALITVAVSSVVMSCGGTTPAAVPLIAIGTATIKAAGVTMGIFAATTAISGAAGITATGYGLFSEEHGVRGGLKGDLAIAGKQVLKEAQKLG